MRDILFKAKRLSDGEWVEGNIVNVPADATVGFSQGRPAHKRYYAWWVL